MWDSFYPRIYSKRIKKGVGETEGWNSISKLSHYAISFRNFSIFLLNKRMWVQATTAANSTIQEAIIKKSTLKGFKKFVLKEVKTLNPTFIFWAVWGSRREALPHTSMDLSKLPSNYEGSYWAENFHVRYLESNEKKSRTQERARIKTVLSNYDIAQKRFKSFLVISDDKKNPCPPIFGLRHGKKMLPSREDLR